MALLRDLTRKLSIDELQDAARQQIAFRRVLNLWQLIGIGLGGLIGVGIFVLTGVVAATQAGPGVALSFLIAGIASGCAALSYAEFASLIPVAGSAYTYAYAVLGEGAAWIIGWDLLLEYALVVAVVSIGWSAYLQSLFLQLGIKLPVWASGAPGTGSGHVIDLFAAIGAVSVSILLSVKIEWGAKFNVIMVIIKIAAVLLVIIVGLPFIHPENWHPFMPFGFSGVTEGAAVVFFAVFGYDTLTTAAEEARNPQRDLPRAILISLAIALTLYVIMALVLTGVARYDSLNNPAPVATAFASLGLPWIALIVSLAAVVGIASVMLAFLMACARIWFAMSRDGLLPEWFAHTHPRFKSPYRPTLIAGALTAIIAAFYPIRDVAELVNIGTLSAFVIICFAVIVLRYAKKDTKALFRTPLMPVTPFLGACFSLWLLSRLPVIAWERFFIWMALGMAIYLFYGRAHSRLNK